MITRRSFLTLGAATVGSGLIGATNAFAMEPRYRLAVTGWDVEHAAWPTSAPPLRIGVMTDIHAVEPWMPARRVGDIAARLTALKPDMIVLLGDYVNALRPRFVSRPVPVREWVAALAELSAPLGVHAVLGNHDWLSGEAPAIRRAFERAGIGVLENRAVRLSHRGSRFWLAGVIDQMVSPTCGIRDLETALDAVTGDDPLILLTHEPDIFHVTPKRVALTLAGHTHGGQVYIPFIGRPGLPRQYSGANADFAYGHIERDGRHMVVSSGLGLSGLPVRFLVPPEIVMITLRGAGTFGVKLPLTTEA
ncbi:metallophosphoesterase [Rhodomicrobium sp. Az07]|uniref:metallophosphoesterase n=1 Tax=Rhodomicrobium sp. Az07 TaxID=2839034 RepID=UPI001BEB0BCE|nr:metallophosphoesterase [Rhodomicrobium sp. Az07]MBT3070504.1 metallophosphoesterase [Rhodomicrobium sp. Az07]